MAFIRRSNSFLCMYSQPPYISYNPCHHLNIKIDFSSCFSGGRYYDHTRNAHIELSSVEVIGPSSTCLLPDLPESRHGHSAARLGDNVVVCGGLSGRHIHERYTFVTMCGEEREREGHF